MIPEQRVRWGILGTARIADKVGAAIQNAADAELTAIASRSLERARDWGQARGVSRCYGKYADLVDDPEIDAVYIPLPPALHAEWTMRAAQAGKHVLCEKPLARSADEAAQMVAACRERGVQLMDGVMWLHHPRAADIRRTLDEQTLGNVQRVTSAFSFFGSHLKPDDLRYQRGLGGGSLGDLGWYCVGAALWVFGELPRRVFGTATFENDVDTTFQGLLWFDDGRISSFDCGFRTSMRRWIEIAGADGSLVCDDFTRPWDAARPRFWLHGHDGKLAEHVSAAANQETCMIEDFCRIVRSGRLEPAWPQAALQTQRVCDALDRSARAGEIIELARDQA